MYRQAICALLMFLVSFQSAVGQESPRLANQPVFVAGFHGWSQTSIIEYLRHLNEDLSVGTSIMEAIDRSNAREGASALDAPASGMLVYLVQGLIPSAEQIQYSEVTNLAEFVKLVQAKKSKVHHADMLEGSDDKYKLTETRDMRFPIASQQSSDSESDSEEVPTEQIQQAQATSTVDPGAEPGKVTIAIGIGSQGIVATSTTATGPSEIVTEGDQSFLDQTIQTTTWFRYHDGFMFTSNSGALWEMSLPSGESLRRDQDSDVNGQIAFYPDRIPMGFRHLAWNAINTISGTELQQRDDESDADYAVRRTSGDAGLALLQACIFDTQEISGSMRLGNENAPVRGELKIEARKNSNLGKSLSDFASARSRFAPILNDDAAATLHFALNLTDGWKTAAEAIRTDFVDQPVDTEDQASAALLEVYHSLLSSADHATLEALLKVGWTEASGAVVYGGLHVDENPNLLKSIHTMFSADATSDESYELIQKGDLQLLQVLVPADASPDPLRFTHLYIAHSESCLWFALGGENAHEILQQSISQIAASSGRFQVPLLTARVDLQRWMAFPEEDSTGLALIPPLLCGYIETVAREFGDARNGDESSQTPDIALRALQLGGSQDLSLVMDADQSGLRIQGQLGTGIARACLATVVNALDKSQIQVDGEQLSE